MMLGPHNYAIYPNDTDMYGNWSGLLSSRSSTSHTRDSTPERTCDNCIIVLIFYFNNLGTFI